LRIPTHIPPASLSRVSNDVSQFDVEKYHLAVIPTNPDGELRFHIGEPITVTWRAPLEHSRRDWIGLYRIGANKSNLLTNVVSGGKWVPVHDDEWDGDVPLLLERRPLTDHGEVVFQKDHLPWQTGNYELRYHHDGKHNVMSIAGPIEIYVDKPASLDFESVRHSLIRIVTLCLDSDPSLVPLSSVIEDHTSSDPTPKPRSSDPDDFRFWSERQAKRITGAVLAAFGVEYAPEVIVADANVTALANRIVNSLELLAPDV
ncbi:phosphatidylethanolamine N-methyltransferase, partial [Ceratobasidium sp. 428]